MSHWRPLPPRTKNKGGDLAIRISIISFSCTWYIAHCISTKLIYLRFSTDKSIVRSKFLWSCREYSYYVVYQISNDILEKKVRKFNIQRIRKYWNSSIGLLLCGKYKKRLDTWQVIYCLNHDLWGQTYLICYKITEGNSL